MTVKDYIKKHEGFSCSVYMDKYQYPTIGYGRQLKTKGISREEAEYLLDNDIKECLIDLEELFLNWKELSPNRQMVLIDLRYQLGSGGFRGFKRLIEAVRTDNWEKAIESLEQSLYYKQVTNRAMENIKYLREG